jgi:glycosyltransferase involved in cell wall biosynthesis
MSAGRRLLVTTIAAREGGVPTMLRFALDVARRRGWAPHLAYYEPYSQSPELSVPAICLGRRRVGTRQESGIDQCPATALGAWLPELEFTHYLPTREWQQLIDGHDAHLVVSGTAIAATALAKLRRSFVAWIATDLDGDRADRVDGFHWSRRWLDALVNRHVLRRIEREVLRSGHVLALSEHTRGMLNSRAGASVVRDVLPCPVDTQLFAPRAGGVIPGRIGFSGRLDDPRKNLGLLLDAFQIIAARRPEARLHLIGHRPGSPVQGWVEQRGLADKVTLHPFLPRGALGELLATMDVYVVPSRQEGLCIAALEAMACGVPVVSTRCGGPSEFVLPGRTGELVDFEAPAMARAITRIIDDRGRRESQGREARQLILDRYSQAAAELILGRAMDQVFPQFIRSSHA